MCIIGQHVLKVSGIVEQPQKAYVLSDAKQKSLQFQHQDILTTIQLPEKAPNPYVSVIVLEYDNYPKCKSDFTAVNSSNGYALNGKNCQTAQPKVQLKKKQKYGSIPEHIVVEQPQILEWQIYVEKPCVANIDLSYHCGTTDKPIPVSISCGKEILTFTPKLTGQTVGEPNSDWHIPKYVSQRVGEFHFKQKGNGFG